MKESWMLFALLTIHFDPSEDSCLSAIGWGTTAKVVSARQATDIPIHSLELLASFPHPADCIERNCWRRDNVFFFFFFFLFV